MTDRERWTVYPLLFLTLGIAVKDRMINLTNTDTVLCNTIVVHDRKGKEQVVITSTPAGGVVRTHGTKTGLNVVMGHSENLAGLMFVDAAGNLHSPSLAIQTGAKTPAPGQATPSEKKPAEDAPPGKSPEAPETKAADEAPKTPAGEQP